MAKLRPRGGRAHQCPPPGSAPDLTEIEWVKNNRIFVLVTVMPTELPTTQTTQTTFHSKTILTSDFLKTKTAIIFDDQRRPLMTTKDAEDMGGELSKREGVLFQWWPFSSKRNDELHLSYTDISLIWTSKPQYLWWISVWNGVSLSLLSFWGGAFSSERVHFHVQGVLAHPQNP